MSSYRLYGKKLDLYNERQKIIDFGSFPSDLTILSNVCLGGRIYHDYHQKFLSPTIDFFMEVDSFIKFCCNLKYYLNYELIPLPNIKKDHLNNFFFCQIGDLIAGFSHTNDSYEKIISKWNERKKRVNYDNIIVIANDRNILTYPASIASEETIKNFAKIPYKKVLFTIKDYKYDYVSYLPSFKDENASPETTRPSLNKKGKYIIEEDGFDLEKFVCNL